MNALGRIAFHYFQITLCLILFFLLQENMYSQSIPKDDAIVSDSALTQPPTGSISSMANSPDNRAEVFRFRITDRGIVDSLPTKIIQITIRRAKDQTADWSKTIGDAVLLQDESDVFADSISITSSAINFIFNVGRLTIPHAVSSVLTLCIYVQSNSKLKDRDLFVFGLNPGDVKTDISGSAISKSNNQVIQSNYFSVQIIASRLRFAALPSSIITSKDFSVAVQVTDAVGNIDTDFNDLVSLSRDVGSGRLRSASGLEKRASAGMCVWNDVAYDGVGRLSIKAEALSFIPALSEGIDCTVRIEWMKSSSLVLPRFHHEAVLLSDGRIAVIGGEESRNSIRTIEVFDPQLPSTNNSWNYFGSISIDRSRLTATVLKNGDVLIAGGISGAGNVNTAQNVCDIWDQKSNPRATGSMNHPRYNHTATLLDDGRVLAAGSNDFSQVSKTCEMYKNGYWTLTSSMIDARGMHTATKLLDGRVLVAGGLKEKKAISLCEIYDPIKNIWIPTEAMHFPRFAHTATLLPSGKVLVTGGGDWGDLRKCEIFDPTMNNGFGGWITTADMSIGRMYHTASLMVDGTVVVVGGWSTGYGIKECELFQPDLSSTGGSWKSYPSTFFQRASHTATVLRDGRIFIVGGELNGNQTALSTCEISTAMILSVRKTPDVSFSLDQNYPNPFSAGSYGNPSTTITYRIEDRSPVRLEILNTLGESIKSLRDTEDDEGTHQVMWDGRDHFNRPVASGVYFYRLTIRDRVLTKKMMLLR